MNKQIGVFTGSRSEFGLLVSVMRAIDAHPELDLKVISGDATPDRSEFPIAVHVPILRLTEEPGSTAQAIGDGVMKVTSALDDLDLDGLVIYGDRYEAFAAMIAATQRGLATAHIEGGDLTQGGTLDDVVRHAMSKLAHLHFPTNADAAQRLKQMGEEDWRITTAGFPPIDLIREGDFVQPEDLAAQLGLSSEELIPMVVFTQHPISTSHDAAAAEIAASLAALDKAERELGARIILTYPNSDIGSAAIIDALEQFASVHPKAVLRKSLGRRLYHGLLNLCGSAQGVCVGNSSSGLKETAAFNCPAVDVGSRQSGRLRGSNVINVPCNADAIFQAIDTALTDGDFRETLRNSANPYGQGNAGETIAQVLAKTDLSAARVIQKQSIF